MEPTASPQGGAPADDACLLTSLPDNVIANLVCPPELVGEGLCVCSRGLTRALLAAPRLDLQRRGIGDGWAEALAGTMERMPCLRELDLGRNGIGEAGATALAGALVSTTGLQALLLKENKLGCKGVEVLVDHLPRNLLRLDLGRNGIMEAGATALAGALVSMPRLQALLLGENKLGCKGVEVLVDHLPRNLLRLDLKYTVMRGAMPLVTSLQRLTSLQMLDLSGNMCGFDEMLLHLTSLQTLDLDDNELGLDDGIEEMGPSLKGLTNLQSLNLCGNWLTEEGIQALGALLQPLTSLQKLDLSINGIFPEGCEALGLTLKHLTNLRELDLSQTLCYIRLRGSTGGSAPRSQFGRLGDEEATALGLMLQSPPGLEKLHLRGNCLSAGFIAALGASLSHNMNLRELDLSKNCLRAEGGQALGPLLQYLTGLQTLKLACMDLGAVGFQALGPSLPHLAGLRELYLSRNGALDEGARSLVPWLQSLTRLRTLDLRENGMSSDINEELGAVWPHIANLMLGERSD